MTNTHERSTERQHHHHRAWLLSTLAAIAVVGASVAAIAVATSGGPTSGGASDPFSGRTGETSAMGMPVLDTPGTSSGTAEIDGIIATPASFAMGIVPLNVAVRPTWQFRNTGTSAITIGEPHVEITQGCCPGAFTVDGPSTLDPGAETSLSFELSMHPGMDGPHDMTIHVPVQHADGSTDTLALGVTGDFHD